MESKGKKRKLVDSLFMTPLQKKKKIQQLLIENQELNNDREKPKKGEISLDSIMKIKADQVGTKPKKDLKGSASSIPDNLRDLELKEISSGDVTAVDVVDQHRCGVEENNDGSDDEGEESDDGSEEEEDCSYSSSDHSEGEDDCSDEEEENEDNGESETFWNVEQMEILKSAVPSFHFLPRTTVDKVVTELKVGDLSTKVQKYQCILS